MGKMNVEVEGATLNVEVDGPVAAPVVLLWHGAGCTLRMWDVVVASLSDRYRLIRFDVRGVGGSTPTAEPASQYTLEQYAGDAMNILDAVDVERCHVWSMAWGSRAALAFCALHPERVVSAALFDASIGRADVEAQQDGARKALAAQQQAGVERFSRPPGWNSHNHPESVTQALAAATRFDLPAAVPRLVMPVLVATGDFDPNLASSRELVDLAPNAQLQIMANVGHGSVLQRPDLAIEVFEGFQASLAAS